MHFIFGAKTKQSTFWRQNEKKATQKHPKHGQPPPRY